MFALMFCFVLENSESFRVVGSWLAGMARFAKEEGLGPPQTLIMFKMSHDILDLIKGRFKPFSAITSYFFKQFVYECAIVKFF